MAESTRAGSAAPRALTPEEASYVSAARDKAFVLYEGVRLPHRSCGIAIAETFNLPSRSYQSLRRGGITGKGACGAIRAGEQVLGELLGDPDPGGAVTAELRAAITWFQEAWLLRIRDNQPDIVCDNLVRPHGDFAGPARKAFCTNLAADVASLTAEALCRFSTQRPPITPIEIP
ncbi:MAG: hypothetical protein JWO36_4443 [Myxococcales bacterium]|nr:hypothetical protein [Myxococcales bacterium]